MDGGASWTQLRLRTGVLRGPDKVEMHVDEHVLAFTLDGSKLYIGNDGGMYSTTDISSSSVDWTELNDTLAITQFYPGLSVHPSNPNLALAGTQDNGVQLYTGTPSGMTTLAAMAAIRPSMVPSQPWHMDLARPLQ